MSEAADRRRRVSTTGVQRGQSGAFDPGNAALARAQPGAAADLSHEVAFPSREVETLSAVECGVQLLHQSGQGCRVRMRTQAQDESGQIGLGGLPLETQSATGGRFEAVAPVDGFRCAIGVPYAH